MSSNPEKMSDEFWEAIQEFMSVAERLESRFSKAQIHSAFLYASSCYSAKFLADPLINHRDTTELLIAEYVAMYEDMLKNGVEHYDEKNIS